MNKSVYLGLAISALRKIKMCEYWYDYIKPKYGENIRLCYMDTDSFIMHIKTDVFYKDIAKDVEKKYDTSNYTVERPVGLRPKCYAYLMDDASIDKKAKGTKNCVIKRCLMFNNYQECLKEKKKILRSQQRFKSDGHDVYTEEINKVALSFSDDKRLIVYDGITTYPYGIGAGILCKQELLSKVSRKC